MTRTEVAQIVSVTCLPPVKLGDVYRQVSQSAYRVVGIVDGYFHWTPTVWHKEILWALGQGVRVFGAASMGALRAAELAPFGMEGIGRIFEAFREGRFPGLGDMPFEDDDEVAVVHGPRETDYRALSEAMINIRCTLARAAEQAVIAESTRDALAARAKALYYPDRNYAPLLALGRAGGLPEHEMAALEHWLPSGRVDQKRADAVLMLEAMGAALTSEAPADGAAAHTFERTVFWERAAAEFRAEERRRASTLIAPGLDPAECERLREVDLCNWYFDRVAGIPVPADLDGWIRQAGYRDRDEFHRAAFSRYILYGTRT
jgi:hypothetical protein